MNLARAAAIALAVATVGCGATASPVDLSGNWPGKAADFGEATAAWTREATLRAPLSEAPQLIFELHATLKSPAWRAAYVDFLADRQKMSKAARADLVAKQKAVAAEKLEVELLLATHDRRMNDLQKEGRSNFRIVIVGADGVERAPIDIKRDRRARTEIAAEFPQLSDFAVAYIASFDKPDQIFSDGTERVVLKVNSAQGGVELVWLTAASAAK